jgi:hypothetical protein
MARRNGKNAYSKKRPIDRYGHKNVWARIARQIQKTAATLEAHLGDMCDFEFTVQDGRLFVLSARRGKRSPRAATLVGDSAGSNSGLWLDHGNPEVISSSVGFVPINALVSIDGVVSGLCRQPTPIRDQQFDLRQYIHTIGDGLENLRFREELLEATEKAAAAHAWRAARKNGGIVIFRPVLLKDPAGRVEEWPWRG